MGDPMPEDEDQRLGILFRAAAQPIGDDGFTDAVMRRVSQRVWQRRLILAAAGASGAAVGFQPIWNISVALGRELAHVAGRWPEFGWVLQNPLAIAGGVLVLAAPAVLHWLEE
jgi:hypothetical protein